MVLRTSPAVEMYEIRDKSTILKTIDRSCPVSIKLCKSFRPIVSTRIGSERGKTRGPSSGGLQNVSCKCRTYTEGLVGRLTSIDRNLPVIIRSLQISATQQKKICSKRGGPDWVGSRDVTLALKASPAEGKSCRVSSLSSEGANYIHFPPFSDASRFLFHLVSSL
jgi:hypothetical protein